MDELFTTVGVEAAWQVTDLATGATLGDRVDSPLPIASLAKIGLAVIAHRLADRRDLDLTQLVTLEPDGRSAGTTGISAMQDPVTLSLRDASYLALTISDNAAGDAIFDAIGLERVSQELEALDLGEIRILEPMRDLYDRLRTEGESGLDAMTTNTATPRALTRLLTMIWNDQAASPPACRTIRDFMGRQVWNQRLAHAFHATNIAVAGKTATAATMRHEVGMITYPGPRHYSAVVLTHRLTHGIDHRADAAIGETARRAIHNLRRSH